MSTYVHLCPLMSIYVHYLYLHSFTSTSIDVDGCKWRSKMTTKVSMKRHLDQVTLTLLSEPGAIGQHQPELQRFLPRLQTPSAPPRFDKSRSGFLQLPVVPRLAQSILGQDPKAAETSCKLAVVSDYSWGCNLNKTKFMSYACTKSVA